MSFLYLFLLLQLRYHSVSTCIRNFVWIFPSLFFLHLDEHAVHFFHFLYSSFVFPFVFCCFFSFTAAIGFLYQWFGVFSCLFDIIYSVNIYIVWQRRRIKFFQAITNFFLFSKFEEIFKSWPLVVMYIYWELPILCVMGRLMESSCCRLRVLCHVDWRSSWHVVCIQRVLTRKSWFLLWSSCESIPVAWPCFPNRQHRGLLLLRQSSR